jgi:hypothetical protein
VWGEVGRGEAWRNRAHHTSSTTAAPAAPPPPAAARHRRAQPPRSAPAHAGQRWWTLTLALVVRLRVRAQHLVVVRQIEYLPRAVVESGGRLRGRRHGRRRIDAPGHPALLRRRLVAPRAHPARRGAARGAPAGAPLVDVRAHSARRGDARRRVRRRVDLVQPKHLRVRQRDGKRAARHVAQREAPAKRDVGARARLGDRRRPRQGGSREKARHGSGCGGGVRAIEVRVEKAVQLKLLPVKGLSSPVSKCGPTQAHARKGSQLPPPGTSAE